jgi:hypothetical protein
MPAGDQVAMPRWVPIGIHMHHDIIKQKIKHVWIKNWQALKQSNIYLCYLISRPSAKMLSLAQHPDYAQHLSVYAVSCTVSAKHYRNRTMCQCGVTYLSAKYYRNRTICQCGVTYLSAKHYRNRTMCQCGVTYLSAKYYRNRTMCGVTYLSADRYVTPHIVLFL